MGRKLSYDPLIISRLGSKPKSLQTRRDILGNTENHPPKKSKHAMFFKCYFHHLLKTQYFGCFVFRRSFLSHILELCRAHLKRLYILQEIDQRRLQMKKCFFMKNWGWDQTHEVKICFYLKSPVFKKVWKKEDQCTSIFHFADRPELPYEVDFWRNSFPTKRFSENFAFNDFVGGWFGAFPKIFLRICKDFGLEPRREMMRGS